MWTVLQAGKEKTGENGITSASTLVINETLATTGRAGYPDAVVLSRRMLRWLGYDMVSLSLTVEANSLSALRFLRTPRAFHAGIDPVIQTKSHVRSRP